MEFLQNLTTNLKHLNDFFSLKENQIEFLNFLKKIPKSNFSNYNADFEIIFMIFCSQVTLLNIIALFFDF